MLGGVCFGRVSGPGGVCLLWGLSAPGASATRGVSAQKVSALGGVCSWGGVVSQHALRETPPVDRITDTCKNITLAKLLCSR